MRYAPYVGLADYFHDLIREFQVELNVLRVHRQTHFGEALKPPRPRFYAEEQGTGRDDEDGSAFLVLSRPEIKSLVAGKDILRNRQTLSVATIATHAEMPAGTWEALHAALRDHRQGRSDVSAPVHPARRLRHYEIEVGGSFSMLVRMMVLSARPGSLYVAAAGNRAGLPLSQSHSSFEDVIGMIAVDPVDWLALLARVDPQDPLFALGVCDWERSGSMGSQPQDRELVPGAAFLADCLGQMVPVVNSPGVLTIDPEVTLDRIVLTPAVREQVEAIDLRMPPGRQHALGILLHGPSGTGKTMLAHALAKRAGKRLVQIEDSSKSHDNDDICWPSVIGDALRRCSVNGTVLFIDEADQLFSKDVRIGRNLLTGMERNPAVVIMATNRPETFDPAFDRRLPVKLHLDVPDHAERLAILRLELDHQKVPLVAGLAEGPGLERLAGTYRLSGGAWRNVVRMASMECGIHHRDVDLEALRRAAQRQLHGLESAVRPAWLAWMESPKRLDEAGSRWLPGEKRQSVQGRLELLNRHGTAGALILVTGPECLLVDEAAEGLAAGLGLPLAYTKSTRSRANGGRPKSDDSSSEQTVDVATTLLELGDGAVLVIRTDRESAEDWMALKTLLPLGSSQRLVIFHITDHTAPAWLVEMAAFTEPWGDFDGPTVDHCWRHLGGEGPTPVVRTLAGLWAAWQRRRMGLVERMTAGALP